MPLAANGGGGAPEPLRAAIARRRRKRNPERKSQRSLGSSPLGRAFKRIAKTSDRGLPFTPKYRAVRDEDRPRRVTRGAGRKQNNEDSYRAARALKARAAGSTLAREEGFARKYNLSGEALDRALARMRREAARQRKAKAGRG